MRSLQDWTRYLEEQEQDTKPAPRMPEARTEPAPAPPQPPTKVEPPKVEEEDVPAFLRVQRETPAEPPKQVVAPKQAPAPKPKPAVEREPAPKPPVEKEQIARAVNLRKRLPKDLSAEAIHQREIASSSYKSFKESREELIQRLVDPVLSLEEVARILNVCPTTVRRYTNRGALAHHRTAGNQRRFRLSDVLAFLEQQSGIAQE